LPQLTIKKIRIYCEEQNLTIPYTLSFGTISKIDSVRVELAFSNGITKTAETVPLPGYSNETKESILQYLNGIITFIINKDIEKARSFIEKDLPKNPFACSPVLTAIDLLDYSFPVITTGINYVIPASSSNLVELKENIEYLRGFESGTLKIKLTGDLKQDLTCLEILSESNLTNLIIRFDANQAYCLRDAIVFYQNVALQKYIDNIDYIEQPLAYNAWKEHATLVSEFPIVKTMLDESIVTNADLFKALSIMIPFVKFKLFKQGGIKELINQIKIAAENGMKVVLGNGVATLLSNEIESGIYLKYPDMIFGACEANGFLKIKNNSA
jgi:O-succinylbenzoate synthase